MSEQELRVSYENQKEFLLAWGEYIKAYIVKKISEKHESADDLLKIPPCPRVKNTNSFLEKALYRNKRYQDPLNDITDKVGLRFVVLSVDEIRKISEIITEATLWQHSKDRDFEEEREAKPELFTYQSIHYIIRNNNAFDYNGILVPANTPCEIQIRTLLQHAYAELSHDIVYKPTGTVPQGLKRKFARSMALIEATDELFREVNKMIADEDEKFTELVSVLKPHSLSFEYNENLNRFIYVAFKSIIEEGRFISDLLQFIRENQYLEARVKSVDASNYLIRKQPIVYLIYFLARKQKYQLQELWPLTEEELRPLFNDVGLCLEN